MKDLQNIVVNSNHGNTNCRFNETKEKTNEKMDYSSIVRTKVLCHKKFHTNHLLNVKHRAREMFALSNNVIAINTFIVFACCQRTRAAISFLCCSLFVVRRVREFCF